MTSLFAALMVLVLASPPNQFSESNPLGISWQQEYKSYDIPKIEKYKYYFGDIDWGKIVYVGQEDLLGTETELQLSFSKDRKITSALLILGPKGFHNYNCTLKYKKILKRLNQKYGTLKTQIIKKDPDLNDLLYNSVCRAVRLQMYTVKSIWITPQFLIEASVFGDDFGTYIEVEYVLRKNHLRENNTRETLRRL